MVICWARDLGCYLKGARGMPGDVCGGCRRGMKGYDSSPGYVTMEEDSIGAGLRELGRNSLLTGGNL